MITAPALAQGTRDFHADLAAEWETKYTESPAVGTADFHLDLKTLTFSWNVKFKGLTGALTTVRIDGPAQPGANGAQMFALATKGASSPLTGSRTITEGEVQYLLYGWTYLNVLTDRFPLGEIRGQLDVRAPQEASQ